MKNKRKKYSRSRICIIVVTAVCLAGSALTANAGPPLKGPGPGLMIKVGSRPAPHIRALPYGYRTFVYGGLTYYFFSGHFYYHGPKGYAVVAAPIGATIRFLPPGSTVVTVGGAAYYTLSGVYYQKIPEGYQIVEPPVVVEAPKQVKPSEPAVQDTSKNGDFVVVAAGALNVRSGPGTDRPIINQVLEGDVLEIQATGSGWYYVKLPDESSGWVMKQYTTPLAPEPVG